MFRPFPAFFVFGFVFVFSTSTSGLVIAAAAGDFLEYFSRSIGGSGTEYRNRANKSRGASLAEVETRRVASLRVRRSFVRFRIRFRFRFGFRFGVGFFFLPDFFLYVCTATSSC